MIPGLPVWTAPTMDAYPVEILTLQGLTIIQLVILIRRIWKFKNVPKSDKWDWTGILIFFSLILILIYIWKKDDEFVEMDKNTLPNNT